MLALVLHLGGVGKCVRLIWGWSDHGQESGDLHKVFAFYNIVFITIWSKRRDIFLPLFWIGQSLVRPASLIIVLVLHLNQRFPGFSVGIWMDVHLNCWLLFLGFQAELLLMYCFECCALTRWLAEQLHVCEMDACVHCRLCTLLFQTKCATIEMWRCA